MNQQPPPHPQQQQYYAPPQQQQQPPYIAPQQYGAPPPQQYNQQQPPYIPPQQYNQQPPHPQQQQYYAPPQQQQPQYNVPPPQQQQQQQQLAPLTSGSILDQVFLVNNKALVKQRVEPFELFSGFETENKYDINFENGYKAVALEDSSFFARWMLGASRPFTLHIAFRDNKQEFLTLERPWKWIFHEVNVLDTTNNKAHLGKIKFRCTFCTRELSILDEHGTEIYRIVAPCCSFWTFYIQNTSEQRVGEIKKKWSGFLKEMYTDADNFGVEFPKDATPKHKALLLAATFLIDFLYFEDNGNNNNRNN
jgi:hypothetical protein